MLVPVWPRGMFFSVKTGPPFKKVGVYSGLHMIEEYFAKDDSIRNVKVAKAHI